MSHRGKHLEAPQAREHNCHLSLQESDSGNRHLPCAKSPHCWEQPLEAGTAAEGFRKPNPSLSSPETNGQARQHCWSAMKASAQSRPTASQTAAPSPPAPRPLLPLWITASSTILSALSSGGYHQCNKLCWGPAGLKTFTSRVIPPNKQVSLNSPEQTGKGHSTAGQELLRRRKPKSCNKATFNPLPPDSFKYSIKG